MKKAIRKITILTLIFFYFLPLSSQVLTKKTFIKAIQDADIYYYYDQNYAKASDMYKSLLNKYPENSNLASKLGICYLNLDGKKTEALQLLTKASLNVVSSDKEYLEYGDLAPLDTYLYLAIAFHQNDSLEKAITLYYEAKKRLSGTKIFKDEYIDTQIRDCMYAIEMKKKPLTLVLNLFADWLINYPGASNPVLSKNDSVFIFTQKENEKTHIFCSYNTGRWDKPVDITRQLGGFARIYSNSITADGKLLIIYMDDGGDGNLYYSHRKKSVWSKIKSLGKPINTIYWQSHGFITPDGKTIYFSSNKPGGEGQLDIWHSEKNDAGKWGEPINCGNVINTPYNEDTPFFDQETGALLFSSVGHTGMGGYDVFRSIKKNGTWTNPIGMPYAFNNTLENTFFILNNDKPGFITSLYDDKTKLRNIYSIVAENPADKITLAIGTIVLLDGMAIDPEQIQIRLVSLKDSTTLKNIPLTDSVSYKFEIKPGDYQLFVNQNGYKTDTINLSIPLYYSGNYIAVSSTLIPDKVSSGEFLSINNVLFDFDSYELDDQAKSGLENLKSILFSYPELNVEVAGYTDAKGGKEYNRELADKRAQTVINYLLTAGAASSRFVKKAFGKSHFVAVNSNTDGSDNPEGRKYNRRVTFGIVDPKTGIIIRKDTYTPEHLRQPISMRYRTLLKIDRKILTIQLKASKNTLNFKRIFSGLEGVNEIRAIDGIYKYYYGEFTTLSQAKKALVSIQKLGYEDAFIKNLYLLMTQ